MGALITEKLNGGSLNAAERAKRTLDNLRGRA